MKYLLVCVMSLLLISCVSEYEDPGTFEASEIPVRVLGCEKLEEELGTKANC